MALTLRSWLLISIQILLMACYMLTPLAMWGNCYDPFFPVKALVLTGCVWTAAGFVLVALFLRVKVSFPKSRLNLAVIFYFLSYYEGCRRASTRAARLFWPQYSAC